MIVSTGVREPSVGACRCVAGSKVGVRATDGGWISVWTLRWQVSYSTSIACTIDHVLIGSPVELTITITTATIVVSTRRSTSPACVGASSVVPGAKVGLRGL